VLFNTEITNLDIIKPEPYRQPLPEWGEAVLDYVGRRIMLEVDQITPHFWSSGNRSARKKLYYLSKYRYLKRYQLYNSERHFIAYTLDIEGMRYTNYYAPEINLKKAQELIIANEFCVKNNVTDFRFRLTNSLTIGEVKIKEKQYTLWCPRESDKRLKSLQTEIPVSSKGLIIVSPRLKFCYTLIDGLKSLYVPVYFVTDTLLNQYMCLEGSKILPV
jgi:hypothetical protein